MERYSRMNSSNTKPRITSVRALRIASTNYKRLIHNFKIAHSALVRQYDAGTRGGAPELYGLCRVERRAVLAVEPASIVRCPEGAGTVGKVVGGSFVPLGSGEE